MANHFEHFDDPLTHRKTFAVAVMLGSQRYSVLYEIDPIDFVIDDVRVMRNEHGSDQEIHATGEFLEAETKARPYLMREIEKVSKGNRTQRIEQGIERSILEACQTDGMPFTEYAKAKAGHLTAEKFRLFAETCKATAAGAKQAGEAMRQFSVTCGSGLLAFRDAIAHTVNANGGIVPSVPGAIEPTEPWPTPEEFVIPDAQGGQILTVTVGGSGGSGGSGGELGQPMKPIEENDVKVPKYPAKGKRRFNLNE